MVWPPRQLIERTLRREGWLDMPREGAIIFRDLVGKLDVLNVECEKCGRFGRYPLDPSYRARRD
jgi:hypothetical protein